MISFVYEWLDNKTNLKYIGRHVGSIDDGYIGSGTVFIKEFRSRPEDFVRNILWQGEYSTDDVVKLKEDEILSKIPNDELYNGINRKYYNQVKNSWGYTSVNNPMKDAAVVARMIETQRENGNKGPYYSTIEKYGIDGWGKLNSKNKIGNTFGKGNKDKPKTEEHKRNISSAVIAYYKHKKSCDDGKPSRSGRKRKVPYDQIISLVKEHGFNGAANYLSITVAALKGRYYNAINALK